MRTRIEPTNIPADLLPRVERLAEFLDEKLDVFQSFEIEAVLSAQSNPDSILLEMGVRDNKGEMRWANGNCLLYDVFEGTDDNIRRWLEGIVYRFTDHLSSVVGENLRRKLAEMQRREPVAVGGGEPWRPTPSGSTNIKKTSRG